MQASEPHRYAQEGFPTVIRNSGYDQESLDISEPAADRAARERAQADDQARRAAYRLWLVQQQGLAAAAQNRQGAMAFSGNSDDMVGGKSARYLQEASDARKQAKKSPKFVSNVPGQGAIPPAEGMPGDPLQEMGYISPTLPLDRDALNSYLWAMAEMQVLNIGTVMLLGVPAEWLILYGIPSSSAGWAVVGVGAFIAAFLAADSTAREGTPSPSMKGQGVPNL